MFNLESTEEFLARGGSITTVAEGKSALKKSKKRKTKSKGVDAQALYDAAVGTPQEAEVIAFLKTQNIEVS